MESCPSSVASWLLLMFAMMWEMHRGSPVLLKLNLTFRAKTSQEIGPGSDAGCVQEIQHALQNWPRESDEGRRDCQGKRGG